LWDRATGAPKCRALVCGSTWRAQALCEALSDSAEMWRRPGPRPLPLLFRPQGSPRAIREHADRLLLRHRGQLSGCSGDGGRVFATDVSNASRTLLMNLTSLSWDPRLSASFGIPEDSLPEIRPSDEFLAKPTPPASPGHPRHRVTGRQPRLPLRPGLSRSGHGQDQLRHRIHPIMMNVGGAPVRSAAGLSSSVGYGAKGASVLRFGWQHHLLGGHPRLAARPCWSCFGPAHAGPPGRNRAGRPAAYSWCRPSS
jgi:glycerol kinase